jgi:SAM-dependent methyltransferase
MSSSDWISFYDSKHWIYVNAKHRIAHCHGIAEGLKRYAPHNGVMIDYGCGESLFADSVADITARLILCEAAPNVRMAIAGRFAGNPKIAIRKPEDLDMMTPRSIDVIVMHSVVQYLSAEELDRLLKLFHRLLTRGGLLVVSDVVPRRLSTMADAAALLRFGVREGFFWAAVFGLLRTVFSGYRRLRKSLGIARYNEDEMINKLEWAGFSALRARTNIGHSEKRMTFLAHVPQDA